MVSFAQVDGDSDRRQVYRLRYEVYCLETGYEDAQAYPDGFERDRWDADAWHFLCRSHDGRPMGTVRLIPATDEPLPMELCCRITAPEFKRIRATSAEVSRLAVLRSPRCRGGARFGDRHSGLVEDCCRLETPLLGLLRLVYHRWMREGLTHLLAMMDRRLQLLLRKQGLRFRPIGPEVET